MSDDRTEMEAARQIGLQKRHERRLEAASYTAAEVKVLTETAAEAGRRIGRKEAAEQIYQLHKPFPQTSWCPECHVKTPCPTAEACWSFIYKPLSAASDATSGVPRHSEVSEAPKAPQEPPKLVCRRCNGYGLLGVTAGVNPVLCPDCTKGDG